MTNNIIPKNWQAKAECKKYPDVDFFPVVINKKNISQISSTFKICESCEVSDACLYVACVDKEQGIWGRTTSKMRDIFLSQRDETYPFSLEECSALIDYLKVNNVYPTKTMINL